MCLAAGIWLEGVNYAIGSGVAAGEAAVDALRAQDTTALGLAGYRRRLEEGFVLAGSQEAPSRAAHRLSDRVQHAMRSWRATSSKGCSRSRTRSRSGDVEVGRAAQRASGLRLRDLAKDAFNAARTYR